MVVWRPGPDASSIPSSSDGDESHLNFYGGSNCDSNNRDSYITSARIHRSSECSSYFPVGSRVCRHRRAHRIEGTTYRVTKGDEQLILNKSSMTVNYLGEMGDSVRSGAYIRVMPRILCGSVVAMTMPGPGAGQKIQKTVPPCGGSTRLFTEMRPACLHDLMRHPSSQACAYPASS
jgi:hypothetical protein